MASEVLGLPLFLSPQATFLGQWPRMKYCMTLWYPDDCEACCQQSDCGPWNTIVCCLSLCCVNALRPIHYVFLFLAAPTLTRDL